MKVVNNLVADFETHVTEVGERLLHLNWESKEAYATWLAQTYYMVRHTTRFCALAAANTDMGARELHYQWIGHLKGELNHDLAAMNDIKALGHKVETLPEFMQTKLIWQNQYYWLDRGPSASLCGYALFLEGLAANYGPKLLERVEAAHGRKPGAFLRVHCESDMEHYPDGLKSLAALGTEEQTVIRFNLEQSAFLYGSMVQTIIEAHGKGVGTTAAKRAA